MERIKLAIKKAKDGEADSKKSDSRLLRGGRAPDPSTAGRKAESGDLGSLQYVQTAVVSLEPEHLDRHRIIAHQKAHPSSWAFDVLRTQVLQKMDENGWRTLAITSPSVESGKTVVAINLAMSIAQQTNRTALLVDFDLRRPSVARYLGLKRPLSLNDYLDGQVGIAEAMVNPGVERLVVLPTNSPVFGASEVLSSDKVGNLISELRERYSDRIVIFDLPPVLAADDVMTVLPRIDCVLMVVASGVSTQNEVEEAMNRLSKADLLGVVLNKDEAPTQNAYY
ncbi:protein tyrosine kinase [Hydrogenophaga crassostreae]|uniref:non-specific protein-tyrosine kinase n=1 Tax=Hydrogenophaga crassostreae TaxID=1763535 RepID=A0A167HVD6_9BURK|nr:CpsD/CapB family tyrosine-protein kinase [Hydrogenophaga crassostreae]AOW13495.1 protein tyrosine kinase [Hydrogenophaga crassostreae]OAD41786.1 protein tyrosine kinase [Hydrogenophaga crassostreae]